MSLNQTAHIECLACIKKQETSHNNGLNVEAIPNVYFTKVSQLCIKKVLENKCFFYNVAFFVLYLGLVNYQILTKYFEHS